MRVEVEFLHDGQALQHNPQAALPQQHASYEKGLNFNNNTNSNYSTFLFSNILVNFTCAAPQVPNIAPICKTLIIIKVQ